MNNQENPRFAQWLDKYRLFRDESTQKRRPFHTKYRAQRRIRTKDSKWYRFATQNIRRELARSLGELHDTAVKYSRHEDLELRERERWSRLAAYIAQTINTVINSYDELKIEATLDELKGYVRDHIEKT